MISKSNGGKTGSPPGLLQDDSRKMFRWFADRIDARWTLRNALKPVKQTTNPNCPYCWGLGYDASGYACSCVTTQPNTKDQS